MQNLPIEMDFIAGLDNRAWWHDVVPLVLLDQNWMHLRATILPEYNILVLSPSLHAAPMNCSNVNTSRKTNALEFMIIPLDDLLLENIFYFQSKTVPFNF